MHFQRAINLADPASGQVKAGQAHARGGGGGGFRRELDEVTLKQVAEMTGGAYYAATSARELQNVFRNLPTYLVVTRETTEISAFFNALGALLILVAIFLSLRWNPVL